MVSVIPDNFINTCSSMKKYKTVFKIGGGMFGQVSKAEHKKTKIIVAVKKLLHLELPSVATSTYKRINIMKKCKHENIVEIIDVCKLKKLDKIELFVIMPLYKHNLTDLIRNSPVKMTVTIVRNILHQLLKAISYIHGNNIIHRNLKPSNIFLSKDGVLKISDFGLACNFWETETNEAYSYRAPELLLGSQRYDRLVDMWSVGCIFVELCTRKNIFKSDSLQNQLEIISDICGSICPHVWPGVECLKSYKEMELPQGLKRKLRKRMKKKIKDNFGIDLLDKLLVLNPKNRITASAALKHTYFDIKPKHDELAQIL